MNAPKKVFVENQMSDEFANWCETERQYETDIEYISVTQLKEWINKNESENPFSEKYHVGKVELLKYIEL